MAIKETDIARPVVEWLIREGWQVYKEVERYVGGPRCDIVATKTIDGKLVVWCIEAKAILSWDLLEQAYGWQDHAHRVSIAIPVHRPKRGKRSGKRWALSVLIDKLNIGNFQVTDEGRVDVVLALEENRATGAERFAAKLHEGMKTFAEAGNNTGGRWSKFQQTMMDLAEWVELNPGGYLRQALKDVPHHYTSDASARNALGKLAREPGAPVFAKHGIAIMPTAGPVTLIMEAVLNG